MDQLFGGLGDTLKRLKIVLVIFHLMNFLFIFTMDQSIKKHFIILEFLLVALTGLVFYYTLKLPKDKTE